MINAIPKIVEDIKRCFWKNNRAGIPKLFVRYATKKNLIPLDKIDDTKNTKILISAIPEPKQVVLKGNGENPPIIINKIPYFCIYPLKLWIPKKYSESLIILKAEIFSQNKKAQFLRQSETLNAHYLTRN